MALSSDFKKSQPVEDLEEVIEALEKLLDRTKVMYEQYFMGIQKVAPMQLHRDVERKVRELTQQQIRNTGLRFRFTTLCQKFGAYNTYWKRTLREIEQGRYVRDLQRAKRKIEQQGEDLPEELLIKLPKLVQDRIRRDRERLARTRGGARASDDRAQVEQSAIAFSSAQPTVHEISEEDTLFDDADIDNLFGSVREQSQAGPLPAPEPEPAPEPPPPPPPRARPIGPIVPASVTSRLKTVATPPAPPPLKPVAGPMVPPPLKPAAPPPKPAPPKPAIPAPPAAALPPGMSEKQCRELHARYTRARELVGDRSDVSYDKLLATLNKQAPAIMKEHGARGVDFQVVVRGDKVVLKAKPVK
ncbi:MAG TPA: MXAN_5187 C-terminal domain-containing protein [Kofleriaceae bacterium]|nr:MXAN_5187 C-terminal domain-containing protein [Kofleriaceae bacterium]